jgi:predicted RNA-binding Zn-ribbon protein involved in translation (DUF1610 family)
VFDPIESDAEALWACKTLINGLRFSRIAINMNDEVACSSCGIRLIGNKDTKFNCPDCGAVVMGRCEQCRDQSIVYKCPKCKFAGP